MLHMMKIAFGIDNIRHLQETCKILAASNNGFPYTLTRFAPKQMDDILQGGSLYRVIAGSMCCRQVIREFIPATRENGDPCIRIVLDPEIIRVAAVPFRPFQGWRYLKPQDAPSDITQQQADELSSLPPKMRHDLQLLGLL